MEPRSIAAAAAVVLCGIFLTDCSSALVHRDKLKKLNADVRKIVWQARVDIRPPYTRKTEDPIYRKGARLKIYVESRGDWIRVKAFPPGKNREQARGRTIIYFFGDDLRDELELLQDNGSDLKMPEFLRQKLQLKLNALLEESSVKK